MCVRERERERERERNRRREELTELQSSLGKNWNKWIGQSAMEKSRSGGEQMLLTIKTTDFKKRSSD